MSDFSKDQIGLGIIGDFFKKIGLKSFKIVSNIFRKGVKGSRPLKDGEFHVLASNFCGPGTRIDLSEVRNYKPLNRPDAVCKDHDIAYMTAEKMPKKQRQALIRKADEIMIKALQDMGKLQGSEEYYRQAGLRGIQFKKYLEDMSPSLAKKLLPESLIGKAELKEDIEESGVLEEDKKQKPNKKMAEATKKLAEKQKQRAVKKEQNKKNISINDIEMKMKGEGLVKDLGKKAQQALKKGKKAVQKIGKKAIKTLAKTKVGRKGITKGKKAVKEFKEGLQEGGLDPRDVYVAEPIQPGGPTVWKPLPTNPGGPESQFDMDDDDEEFPDELLKGNGMEELPNNSLPQAVGRAGNPRFMNKTFLQLPVRRDLQLQSGGNMCDNIMSMRRMRKDKRF